MHSTIVNAQEIIDIETKHSAGTYAKQPLVIVRGQGASLFDADGVEYLDCSSGHGVANLGHAKRRSMDSWRQVLHCMANQHCSHRHTTCQ